VQRDFAWRRKADLRDYFHGCGPCSCLRHPAGRIG
jgi:hypothetical protein